MNKLSLAVVTLFIVILVIGVYLFFPNIFSFFNRNKVVETSTNEISIVKYSISPKEIKSTENATIEISIKNDGKKHDVQIVFYTNKFVKIYLPDWEQLNMTKVGEINKFVYSFYIDPAFQEVSLNFMLKGSLSNLVNSAEYTVALDLLVNGTMINRTWNNATVTIRK